MEVGTAHAVGAVTEGPLVPVRHRGDEVEEPVARHERVGVGVLGATDAGRETLAEVVLVQYRRPAPVDHVRACSGDGILMMGAGLPSRMPSNPFSGTLWKKA